MAKQYAWRDALELGDYYLRHVGAMTAEGLHGKSDIAAELAWRDREIDRLRAALSADREGEAVAVPRELLDALLKRDSVKRFNGECGCINHSRDAEREYESGKCPHQRLRALLAAPVAAKVELPAEDHREAASIDAVVYGIGFLVDGKHVAPSRVEMIRAVMTAAPATGQEG